MIILREFPLRSLTKLPWTWNTGLKLCTITKKMLRISSRLYMMGLHETPTLTWLSRGHTLNMKLTCCRGPLNLAYNPLTLGLNELKEVLWVFNIESGKWNCSHLTWGRNLFLLLNYLLWIHYNLINYGSINLDSLIKIVMGG